jgi:predicted enzyme related to lactoylglutathione lyase
MLGSYPVAATLPAVDIKRATKFYTEVLGLKAKELGEGAVLFEAGNGTQIFMYQRGATKAEHTAASFYVDDIDKVVDGLIAKGVTFEQYDMGDLKTDARGIAAVGPSKAAWLKDTEGNILSLGVM